MFRLIGSVARLHRAKNLSAAIRMLRAASGLASGAGRARSRARAARSAGAIARCCGRAFISPASSARSGSRSSSRASTCSFSRPWRRPSASRWSRRRRRVSRSSPMISRSCARFSHAEEGPCALFVDANDTAAFAAAVERLLHDGALRATLIARSRGLEARYSVDAMTDRYADLIQASVCRQVEGDPCWRKPRVRGAERTSTTARVEAPPVRHVTMVVDPRSARVAHGEIARRLSEAGVQVSRRAWATVGRSPGFGRAAVAAGADAHTHGRRARRKA